MNILRIVPFGLLVGLAVNLAAQSPAATKLWPNLENNIGRPLRYRPDGQDFVIENGTEFFNRPLYGGNTAFRVDGGDRPEFVLYLPGRGGNLRLGIRTAAGAKWLHEATHIVTRYRPGELIYEIRDPLLGPNGGLRLSVVAWHETEGLGLRVEAKGIPSDLELVWAYGGVNGQRGARDGDIGTERVPISEWFQLQPEFCRENRFEFANGAFTLRAKAATVVGVVPADTQLAIADAAKWNDLPALVESVGPALAAGPPQVPRQAAILPVVLGRAPLSGGGPMFLSLQRLAPDASAAEELATYREVGAPPVERVDPNAPSSSARRDDKPFPPSDVPARFSATEAHFASLRDQVKVDTPDPYLNAAVAALNVAADAVWDKPQRAIMHGAIAWRTKLLGWRGPYALDALGWYDRARANLTYWAGRQNTNPIPEKLPPPDASANLARSESALHSNGDLSNSHYDMNAVFIDGLFRHLLWTGDVDFAKRMWPVIERHLAWERRLFRREFDANGAKLPLYEAYAAIWASDDLQYSGGGAAHSSAYNYWHNRMAARIAPLVGADPATYTHEAERIAHGMRELLWVDGHFAESKDWLGRQLVHPSAGLWTFYHTMDSGVPNAEEAVSMAAEILRRPRIPVRGPGVPADAKYFMLPTTDWMPYTWSLNNVVMGENAHTALGLWEARFPEDAFVLLKSSLLASMFMGISPGNVGSMNYLDVYRRESQRDFADGSGVLSRAIVEGLFGIRPDALAGELTVAPGFPAQWNHAKISHPAVEMEFTRDGATDSYRVTSHNGNWRQLRMILPARAEQAKVSVGGRAVKAAVVESALRRFQLEFVAPLEKSADIHIEWSGVTIAPAGPSNWSGRECGIILDEGLPPESRSGVDLTASFNDRVTEIFRPGKYLSPRSPFVSLALPSQGMGYWAGHVNASAEIDDTGLRAKAAAGGGRMVLPNGVPFATPGPGTTSNIVFVSQWDNYPREATVPLTGKARAVHLLMAGSTNAMQSRIDNGEVVATYADGTTSRLALCNPETWWPIEQDYFIDDYQFRFDGPLPTRVDLKTGEVRVLDAATFKGQGRIVPGGAATVLQLELDPNKELRSLTVRALANDVVIGLMAATLAR